MRDRWGLPKTFLWLEHELCMRTTKLASELLVEEYKEIFGLQAVITRLGVVAGPLGQMGKVDLPGVSSHCGSCALLRPAAHLHWVWRSRQTGSRRSPRGGSVRPDRSPVTNVGRPQRASFQRWWGASLAAYPCVRPQALCRRLTGQTIPIDAVPETRSGDVRVYITDNRNGHICYWVVAAKDGH